MSTFNDSFDYLSELIRKVSMLIDPTHHTLDWLMNKDARDELFEKYPKCFLSLPYRNDVTILPICNRKGMIDPNIIKISLKIIDKLEQRGSVNIDDLKCIRKRLQMLYTRYSKNIPTAFLSSINKSKTTRLINKLKQQVNKIKAV